MAPADTGHLTPIFANGARLDVIDLDQSLPGYRQFLSCWVYRASAMTFIVDPGPMSSVAHLLDSLRALEVDRIDYILLTHIHLDHAGATGRVLESYPDARVLCHERGVRHLLDPGRLWEGSLAVLGEVAEMYGSPPRVPEACLATVEELARAGVRSVPTPGHAPHHLSFVRDRLLFAGEMVGTRHALPDHDYLRPATPPKFILEVALESFDRLLALDPQPQRLIFAHYGIVDAPANYLRAARDQMSRWTAAVRDLIPESKDDLQERAHERLLRIDPYYSNFPRLPEDIRQREYHYMGQTLEGMQGYIESTQGA